MVVENPQLHRLLGMPSAVVSPRQMHLRRVQVQLMELAELTGRRGNEEDWSPQRWSDGQAPSSQL